MSPAYAALLAGIVTTSLAYAPATVGAESSDVAPFLRPDPSFSARWDRCEAEARRRGMLPAKPGYADFMDECTRNRSSSLRSGNRGSAPATVRAELSDVAPFLRRDPSFSARWDRCEAEARRQGRLPAKPGYADFMDECTRNPSSPSRGGNQELAPATVGPELSDVSPFLRSDPSFGARWDRCEAAARRRGMPPAKPGYADFMDECTRNPSSSSRGGDPGSLQNPKIIR